MQPTDASTEGAAGEVEAASTDPLTVSGPLPGAGIAAEGFPMEGKTCGQVGWGLLQPPSPTGGDSALPSHPVRAAYAMGFPPLPQAECVIMANPSPQEL